MAVLLIVIVISLIAAPTIFNVVETSKRESFLVNARQILRIVDNEKLSNSTFDLSQINPETMMDLIDIPGEYYESITFKEYNDNLFINVSVADRWKGLSACGSYNSLTVVKGKCELDNEAPRITFNPNGSTSYIKSSNVEVSVVDSFLDEESLKYVWTTTEEEPLVEEYVNIFKNMSNIPMPDGNGSFFLHVIAKDTLDNIAKEYRGFLLDNEAPVITVNGDINITINKGTAYVDLGATAIDNADGDLTSRIVTTGTVNPNMLGTYTITYTVSDNSGNIATKTRTVNVVDTVGPVITFGTNGNSTYAKSRSTTVTVTDSYSSIDTSNLKYLWSTESTGITETNIQALFTNGVNLTSPSEQTGIYYLWILAKDSAGNTTVARSHAFYLDNTKPVITLSGSSTINVNVGTTYTDAGATASDEHSGLNGNINVTNTVNTSIVGTYTITYNISDKAGNAAVQVTRTVNVIDNVAPTIVFGTNGNSTYAKNRSTTVTVSDAHSTVNTSSLKYLWNTSTTAPSEGSFGTSFTNGGTVNSPAATTGIYYLWILAKDSVGNTNIQRSNAFYLDNAIPTISSINLNGYTPGTWATGTLTVTITASDSNSGIQKYQYSVDSGSSWYDISASWSIWDGYDGITIFRVVDAAGNASANSSTYHLRRDVSKPSTPTVNLNGYTSGAWSKVNITFSLSSTDSYSGVSKYQYSSNGGSTWTDFAAGTNGKTYSADIQESLIFRSMDGAGNTSVATGTYTFRRDATKPTITITGNNPATVYVGDSYTDAGATATDNLSGLSGSVVVTGTVNPSIIGTYTITYTVSDNAGNIQTATRTVNVVQRPFMCGTDKVTDSKDGQQYKTVQIGTQCWMAENLKYTGSGCLSKNWLYAYLYAYDACRTHTNDWGTEVLYQWKAATNGSTTEGAQGLCPDGWHLPTIAEWTTLESYLGTNPGTKLKYVGYWSNGTESNTSGFSALPTGRRTKENSHTGASVWTGFWTSTPAPWNLYNGTIYTEAYYRYLRSNYSENYNFFEASGIGAEGYSIRCIKN